ncbi:uncharacterized protein J4E92_004949, partial [Alternaria infectoria]|uniref:uncharacterized protein n=1 Tax=Alternaria infectoria TaxID=45303 RepID=UPI0022207A1A
HEAKMSLGKLKLFSNAPWFDTLRLATDKKCELINAFWPHLNLTQGDYNDENYKSLLSFWGETLQSLMSHRKEFAVQDWDDLRKIVVQIRLNPGNKRRVLTDEIKKAYHKPSDEEIACSIELVVQLWLGIRVHSTPPSLGPVNLRDTQIHWPNDQSFESMVTGPFLRGTKKAQSAAYFLFDDSFTAAALKKTCRLRIHWTDSLVDHLKMEGTRGKRQLSIFKHKISLVNHRNEPNATIIPADVLDETIRTLDLLFPFGDKPTKTFLEHSHVNMEILNPLELPRATELDEFLYWRSRLAQLLSLFHGPPETVRQTLVDSRNIAQFATIWVAIFGVFFLTILFGVLSTVYSAKQYNVAVESYQLALAQACCQQTSPLLPICAQSTAKLC